jgi:uncharacterized DUF497 family protein
MKFDWDQRKAELNLKKHRISFEEATTVFFDPLAKIANDPDHSGDEHRQILIGYSHTRKLLFVVHVFLESKDIVRIIAPEKQPNEKDMILRIYRGDGL